MQFQVGDKVVYPNQGISVVEDIERPEGADGAEFYRLKLMSKSTLVMVPIHKVEEVGIRPIMTEGDVDKVFDVLEHSIVDEGINWKTRYKDNSDRMKSGSPVEVAEVLKGLFYLSERKSLSFREKRMLDRAHQLTVSEVAEVAGEQIEDVERKVIESLRRSRNIQLNLNEPIEVDGDDATTFGPRQNRPRRNRRRVRESSGKRPPISISIKRYF